MTPRATYRLQFHPGFGFDDAAALAPYLAKLGVSHIYGSSYLKARAGSSHGYDIVDHNALNPELGSAESFARMVAAFRANGLGQILDFVPNHMGVGGADNPLWLEVLEWGADAIHAGWFDIDWDPEHRYLHGKLLVPVLGDQYGIELENGKLRLRFDEQAGSFAIWAYDVHKLPICPLDYARILGDSDPSLERLGDSFSNLPQWRTMIQGRAEELKSQLARVAQEDAAVRHAIRRAVDRFNGDSDGPTDWRRLDALIQLQHWRAAHFRVAADDINYRRFFNIHELAGLRMEVPEVFDDSHRFVFQLLRDGTLDGLRIDHVDGLLDPKGYLRRLRDKAFDGDSSRSFYLVVEKILAHHESLPEDWPVDGTTGYDFTNQVLSFLIDAAAAESFDETYTNFTGDVRTFDRLVRDSKMLIMENEMTSELTVLARDITRLAHQNPRTADFTHNILRRSVRAIVAYFPIYRTYLDGEGSISQADRRYLEWALAQARRELSFLDPSVFDFLYELLSGDLVSHPRSGFSRQAALRCAMKFQQYSGPVMAKGLEDTAFYRYHRFVAQNEVGGSPERLDNSLSYFHKTNAQRAKRYPAAMLATSSHDTKRGEDTRARLAALSELPKEWPQQVRAWSRLLRARRGDVEGTAAPDRGDEYLLYQLMAGTWPAELTGAATLDREALSAYANRLKRTMVKSLREAKTRSTWARPDEEYEEEVQRFIDDALDPDYSTAFLSAFLPFQETVARLGLRNSLVQTALKLTLPGVPDIYQGAELWDLSMVDPDNRRPVDYAARMKLLDAWLNSCPGHREQFIQGLLEDWRSGGIKLALTAAILGFRRENSELFREGSYEPLETSGSRADQVYAFLRRSSGRVLLVAVSRFPGRRQSSADWDDTAIHLPADLGVPAWKDLVTGATIKPSEDRLSPVDGFRILPLCALTPLSSS